MKEVFFSYNFIDKDCVAIFYSILAKYTDCKIYFYDEMSHEKNWQDEVKKAIKACDYFVLFMGEKYGKIQEKEVAIFERGNEDSSKYFIAIKLLTFNTQQFDWLPTGGNSIKLEEDKTGKPKFFSCARVLAEKFMHLQLRFCDDLPSNPHLFDYEKTIIDFYITKEKLYKLKIDKKIDYIEHLSMDELKEISGQINDPFDDVTEISLKEKIKNKYEQVHRKLLDGCPPRWPKLVPKEGQLIDNEIKEFGEFRPHNAVVVAAALSKYHHTSELFCMIKSQFVFPEAGPRKKLYFPKYSTHLRDTFRVAVLVSGGIAPGINAVIDGITQRHYKYFKIYKEKNSYKKLELWGLKNGFHAFRNLIRNIIILKHREDAEFPIGAESLVTSDHVNEGGSVLGTSRFEDLLFGEKRAEELEKIVRMLRDSHIRILYIIGGDGSMKAAHALSYIAKEKFEDSNWDLSVIGIPKTMDNDILWVWQTFGFLSAVEKGREFIDQLAVEIKSNPRLGVVQLFGSDSGFVVSHAVLASRTGICDVALIPEVPFSMKKLRKTIKENFDRKESYHGLIVMAETAIPSDAMDYVAYMDRIPEYINQKQFENNILEKLPENDRDFLKKHLEFKDKKYKLVEKLGLEEEKKIRKILIRKELKFLKFINYGYIDIAQFGDIVSNLTAKESEHLKNHYNIDPQNQEYILDQDSFQNELANILRSIGYYNFIDIDLSKDEKDAIIEYFELKNQNKRIQGQTNDSLRTAGLKIVSRGIKKLDKDWGRNFRVLTSEPRHLLRAIPPSTSDIIFGNRMGTLAVDNAMAGYTDFMISQWLTEYVLVPLKLVVLGRKRIPESGVFWKSVLAKTGQPEDMV
jgi:6-phosphofructokinase